MRVSVSHVSGNLKVSVICYTSVVIRKMNYERKVVEVFVCNALFNKCIQTKISKLTSDDDDVTCVRCNLTNTNYVEQATNAYSNVIRPVPT